MTTEYQVRSSSLLKILIKGNHDKFKPKFYLQHFKDIRGCHNLDNFLLTHIPVHPECKSKFKLNIHGHVHANSLTDTWYYNTCVEVNNYAPIPFEEIKQIIRQQQRYLQLHKAEYHINYYRSICSQQVKSEQIFRIYNLE